MNKHSSPSATNQFYRQWTIAPNLTARTLVRVEEVLAENMIKLDRCPACLTQFLPDDGNLNSFTLAHREGCMLMDAREVIQFQLDND